MTKVKVTYKAPPGDAKVIEAYGTTLHDGKPEEIDVDDDTLARIKGNKCFEVEGHDRPADKSPDKGHDDKSAHEAKGHR